MNGFRASFDLILLLARGKDIQLLLREYAKKYNLYLYRHYFYYDLYPGIVIKWFYRFTLRCLIAALRISKLNVQQLLLIFLALWSSRFSLSRLRVYRDLLHSCICIYMQLCHWYLWGRLPEGPLLYLHMYEGNCKLSSPLDLHLERQRCTPCKWDLESRVKGEPFPVLVINSCFA